MEGGETEAVEECSGGDGVVFSCSSNDGGIGLNSTEGLEVLRSKGVEVSEGAGGVEEVVEGSIVSVESSNEGDGVLGAP